MMCVECCRLIITTRSLEVCRQIGCQKIIPVEKLRRDEAWELFIETLGNEIQLDYQVEEIAKSMAKLCDGLPLGIITVAGSMRGETSIHRWANASEGLNECVVGQDGMGDDDVYKVLKHSFDRLNRDLPSQSYDFNTFQLCFLHCSLYPEDEEIPKEILVRSFISEGLMDHRKSRRAQVHQGHSILDKLVNVCLLESYVDYAGRECVKMHDLVRGMEVTKIGEGKYMVRAGNYSLKEIPDEQEWTKGLEKVSLVKSGIKRIGDGISPNCHKLSTLLLWGNPLEFIPDSFFSKMQGLCTLNLCETVITTLPDSICDMKSLKALLLENCYQLESVPYLGKLKALRELNLSKTAIKEVPQGLEDLLNLKFLSMNARQLKMLPRGLLLKLGHLEHLDLPFHIQVPIEEIENLKQLHEFSGGLKNVKDFNCFTTSWVRDTFYSIGAGSYDTDDAYRIGGNYKNELILCECNLEDEKVLLQGVVYLKMRKCEGLSIYLLDDFSQLNNPTSLKRLEMSSCGGIEFILRREQYHISKTLEELVLVKLEDLKGLVIQKRETGVASAAPAQPKFSSLRSLTIEGCNKMRKVGLTVLGVPNLESIKIVECGEIDEIFEDEGRGSLTFPKLKRLSLIELPRLRNVGLPVLGVPNLETITITECREIEEIFEDEGRGFVTLSKLKELSLIELPRLRNVGLPVLGVPNLETITIMKCREIEKMFEDEGRGSLTFPKLKRLSLIELPRLRKVGLPVLGVPNLEKITVGSCGEIEEIFKDEGRGSLTFPKLKNLVLLELPRLRKLGLSIVGVPNLQIISISCCREIEEIFEDEGRGFVTLSKLKELILLELPRLRKVGLTVLGVPNLEEITIGSCGEIEEIFKDEGRGSITLPKLQSLWLYELPRLRKVGLSVLVVPNLEVIQIHQCGGEIEEIFEDEGSGFITLPKLKHLSLWRLPRLKSVCKDTMICNSIETIFIRECPRLMKKLPRHLDVASPLRLVGIIVEREWWESLEWDNPDLPQLLHNFLNFGE